MQRCFGQVCVCDVYRVISLAHVPTEHPACFSSSTPRMVTHTQRFPSPLLFSLLTPPTAPCFLPLVSLICSTVVVLFFPMHLFQLTCSFCTCLVLLFSLRLPACVAFRPLLFFAVAFPSLFLRRMKSTSSNASWC